MLSSQYTTMSLYFVSSKLLVFAVFSLTYMRMSDVDKQLLCCCM
jgi:hypothetical protein